MNLDILAPSGVLDMSEHETRRIAMLSGRSEQVLAAAGRALAPAITKGLITLSATTDRDGASYLIISTTSVVGFASSGPRTGGGVFVRVRPKVGTGQLMALASLAGMLPQWSSGGAYVAATLEAALLTWTLHAFADSLSRLIATGGLRNSHERVRRELDSRLRGRLLVGPWLRNVARGSPHLLPVEFPSLELDNQSNQTLRWALHVGILVARELPDTADLIDQLRREERHFTGVSLIRPAETALFLKGLPPNHRHYTEALQLARLVIANFHLGGKPGELKGTAFALDMNQVYERAFFQGLRSIEPSAIRQAPWMVSLVPVSPEDQGKGVVRTTRMLPDVLVPPDPVTGRVPVIMDTKWKAVMPDALSTDEEGDLVDPASRALVRVRPTDLYQATAYALEALQRNLGTAKESGGCLTALIYPTLVDVPDLGREIQIGESRILVRLVGWNVDRSPSDGIAAIWDRLCTAAEGRESSEHPDPRGRTP